MEELEGHQFIETNVRKFAGLILSLGLIAFAGPSGLAADIDETGKLIDQGRYVRALDQLSQVPASELRTYYAGVCYEHLNQTNLALKEFSWLLYYGKDPQIHKKVLECMDDLERRGPHEHVVQSTAQKNFDAFQRKELNGDRSSNDFFATVRLYFNKWDVNHDGILTGDEIAKALQSPNLSPQEAVALAALKTQERFDYRQTSNFQPFTLSELASIQNSLALGNHDAQELVRFYRIGINKVLHQSMRLFAHQLPHINGIKQGHTSDCYFLAVVGSMVTVNPQGIKRMISPNADGTYTVSFYGVSPVSVAKPTLGEIATYADSGGDGYWLTVLEKAYAIRKEELSKKGVDFVEPLDAVTIHGGNMNPVVLALTGHKALFEHFREEANRQNARQKIQDAEAGRRLVATDVPGHCLAIIRYEPMADRVTIWNPWGSSGYYDKAGATMKNGFFTLSMYDYLHRFEGVCIER